MDEKSLYAHILNLTSPWQVKYLTLDENAGSVTVSHGSSSPSAQRYIPSAQHVVHHATAVALYVVLYPWTVMRRAGAENSDMMISSVWHTSGKSFIQIKSDPYETGMR
ncbi:TPA: hypothetical protein N6W72_005113 [Escherichia coli]|nr:hypothetical protein [Escherichia coli]HCS0278929.1 hypothetical protein [Escherichia coli]